MFLRNSIQRHHIILIGLLLIGLFLRVQGANWGLPQLLHPDEWEVTDNAYWVMQSDSWDPQFYNHPNHPSIYLHGITFAAASELNFGKPLADTYMNNKWFYHHISRIMVALFGAASIIIAYLIGARFERNIGLFAAAIMGFQEMNVDYAHIVRPDVLLVFFSLCCTYFLVRYTQLNQFRDLALASIMAGLATATKYCGVACFAAIGLIIAYQHHRELRRMITKGAKAGAVYFIAFFLAAPYVFFKIHTADQALYSVSLGPKFGHDGFTYGGNIGYYLTVAIDQMGWALIVLAAIGIYAAYKSKDRMVKAVPVLVGITFVLVLSISTRHKEQWVLPMLIAPMFLASFGIHFALQKMQRWIVIVLIAGALVHNVTNATLTSLLYTQNDTRIISQAYTKQQGINYQNTFYEGYTPLWPGRPKFIFYQLADPALRSQKPYIILSSMMYDRAFRRPIQEEYVSVYEKLFSFPPLAEFTPGCRNTSLDTLPGKWMTIGKILTGSDVCYRGPTIKILKNVAM